MLSRVRGGRDACRLLRLLPFERFAGLRADADLLHEMRRLERLCDATLRREGARP